MDRTTEFVLNEVSKYFPIFKEQKHVSKTEEKESNTYERNEWAFILRKYIGEVENETLRRSMDYALDKIVGITKEEKKLKEIDPPDMDF